MKQKHKNYRKEPTNERKDRIELSGAVQTRIVPDKKKYSRKVKHISK